MELISSQLTQQKKFPFGRVPKKIEIQISNPQTSNQDQIKNEEQKDQQTQQQVVPSVQKIIKKKTKLVWDPKLYKLVSISHPEPCDNQGRIKNRKFYSDMIYKDLKTQKCHRKRMRFGIKGREDFIDGLSEQKRQKLLSKLKNTDNLFCPNHWRAYLLNNSKNIDQAYLDYIYNNGLSKKFVYNS